MAIRNLVKFTTVLSIPFFVKESIGICDQLQLISTGTVSRTARESIGKYSILDKRHNGQKAYQHERKEKYLYYWNGEWLIGSKFDEYSIKNDACHKGNPWEVSCKSKWKFYKSRGTFGTWEDDKLTLNCTDNLIEKYVGRWKEVKKGGSRGEFFNCKTIARNQLSCISETTGQMYEMEANGAAIFSDDFTGDYIESIDNAAYMDFIKWYQYSKAYANWFKSVNCIFRDWTNWGQCDKTCGNMSGIKSRNREKTRNEKHGGYCSDVFGKVEDCYTAGSVSCPIDCQWGDWQTGQCNKVCGGGWRMKSRVVVVDDQHGGNGCRGLSRFSEKCNEQKCQACEWNGWYTSSWSDCSKECGTGKTNRTRKISKVGEDGGAQCISKVCTSNYENENCETREKTCNTYPCPDEYRGFVKATEMKCKAHYAHKYPEFDDAIKGCRKNDNCYGVYDINCNYKGNFYLCINLEEMVSDPWKSDCVYEKKVNCKWDVWSSWTNCSRSCHDKIENRTRTFLKKERNSGNPCLYNECHIGNNETEDCLQSRECEHCKGPSSQIGIKIGASIAAVVALVGIVTMSVVFAIKRKASEAQKRLQAERDEDDNYDMVEEEQIDRMAGDIYGDIDEDLDIQESEFQVVQNPYYDGDGDIGLEKKQPKNRGRKSNEIEMVTKTKNVYYEM